MKQAVMMAYEKVWKLSGQFRQIHPPIPTWNQDIYQETWKDINRNI